ncbi:MAG: hypothetical protein AAFX08_07340 [Pseudomonadota bacterium]
MSSIGRHFILTNGRSGSNFFAQALNQHPQIVNYGEVLGDWTLPGRLVRDRFTSPALYLDWLFASRTAFYAAQAVSAAARTRRGKPRHMRRRADISSIGVKEFVVNLRRFSLDAYLADRAGIALVSLIRENPVDRYVSVRLLADTGRVSYRAGDEAAPQAQIEVDPGAVINELDLIREENEAVRAIEDAHEGPVFRLRYETFFGSSEQEQTDVLASLQEFLGVAPRRLSTEHKRLRKASLARTIKNYAAFAAALKGSRYQPWLDEDEGGDPQGGAAERVGLA